MNTKRILSLFLALITVLGLAVSVTSAAEDSPYTDVKPKRWSYADIMYATENGLMNGTSADKFAPAETMTRAMVVQVLYNLLTTGEVENAVDIFQPKNIRAYVKTLTSDADMRHILSTEFQGLLEAAKKARASIGEAKELPPAE